MTVSEKPLMRNFMLVLFVGVAFCVGASQAQTAAATPVDKEMELVPSDKWTDTGIDVHPGDTVEISAATVGNGAKLCDPQGLAELVTAGKLPLESALGGALIAKMQEKSEAPIFVGALRKLRVSEAGRLYLGSNLSGSASCNGKYAVKIHLTPGTGGQQASIKSKLASAAQIWMAGQLGGSSTSTQQTGANPGAAVSPGSGPAASSEAPGSAAVKALAVSAAPIEASFGGELQSLPRRVNDEFKNPGDMVNFVLVGPEKVVQEALADANWHVADTNSQGAAVKAILMATQKQDYLQMPMSQLYLFDRVQDFGYEQAEPYAMVASRHHFRLWKTTLSYQGQPVWVGAGTHDVGFEKDQRNGKVTHKIDPAVDGERDHIGQSLQEAGRVKMMNYFMPSDPVQEAHNATGGGYHSDGRVLVIVLQ